MKPWKLNDLSLNPLDRLKLAYFCLTSDRWTQGEKVKQFEADMAKFTGYIYAIFVSSGSTANTILASYAKDILKIRTVAVPSTTWTTSISPWIRTGVEPIFNDINLLNLSIDLDKFEQSLPNRRVDAVFITSLLGFMPDMPRLEAICKQHNIHLFADHCESTLAIPYQSVKCTCTTSTYQGHQIGSIEGGFILTNDEAIYHYALLSRNHGLVRALSIETQTHYLNDLVDPQFDFAILGNNFRNIEFNAYIGSLDLVKASKYTLHRRAYYDYFLSLVPIFKFITLQMKPGDVPFSIPIIYQLPNHIERLKQELTSLNIEHRPIISGNLLRQTPYKQYGNPKNYSNSEHLHFNGLYVGLHNAINKNHIDQLIELL